MSRETFGLVPFQITQKSDSGIIVQGGTTITMLDAQRAQIQGNAGVDTLYRIQQKVQGFEDYDCDMHIAWDAYREVLWHEFVLRSLQLGSRCQPNLLEKLDQPAPTLVSPDTSLFANSTEAVVDFTYTIQRASDYSDADEDSFSVVYNPDSSRVLVEFSDRGTCNDGYTLYAQLKKDGTLFIDKMIESSGCMDACLVTCKTLLEGWPPLEIDRVLVNGKLRWGGGRRP